jgi:transposase-like protein
MANEAPQMSQKDRFERRRQMAQAVREGQDVSAVAREYKVTRRTVLDACREQSVRVPPAHISRLRTTSSKAVVSLA